MLRNAIEAEVASYIETHVAQLDENGRRLVVRNGYLPEREIITWVGQYACEVILEPDCISSAVLLKA